MKYLSRPIKKHSRHQLVSWSVEWTQDGPVLYWVNFSFNFLVKFTKVRVKRRTSHEPNWMQMRKTLCSPSFISSIRNDSFLCHSEYLGQPDSQGRKLCGWYLFQDYYYSLFISFITNNKIFNWWADYEHVTFRQLTCFETSALFPNPSTFSAVAILEQLLSRNWLERFWH